jgi:hypothetical protein
MFFPNTPDFSSKVHLFLNMIFIVSAEAPPHVQKPDHHRLKDSLPRSTDKIVDNDVVKYIPLWCGKHQLVTHHLTVAKNYYRLPMLKYYIFAYWIAI